MRELAVLILGFAAILYAQDPPSPAEGDLVFGTTVVRPSGLKGDIYMLKRGTDSLPNFRKLEPVGAIYTDVLNVPPRNAFTLGFPGVEKRSEYFAIDYNGRFWVENPGKYEFAMISDDGSKLYIDGHTIIDNDGVHASVARGGTAKLSGGIHTIRVSYFQGPCGDKEVMCVQLELGVKGPRDEKFRYFSTDEFKPPVNPSDWKYGDATVEPKKK